MEIFLKNRPPPPLEKIIDPPLVLTSLLNYWFLSFVENSFMKSCSNVLKIYQNIYQRCFFSFDQFWSSRLQVLMDFFCITLNMLELKWWKTILYFSCNFSWKEITRLLFAAHFACIPRKVTLKIIRNFDRNNSSQIKLWQTKWSN